MEGDYFKTHAIAFCNYTNLPMTQMKQIIFIQHALDRLKERGISKELVIEIIRNPDNVDIESERRKIAQKLIKGKLLRIVYDDEDESIVVISAYNTSKVHKYLRK